MSEEAKEIARKYFVGVSKIEKEFEEKDKEIERLNNIINKALHKLRASKDHFKTERENNVITFTIRILKGEDKE